MPKKEIIPSASSQITRTPFTASKKVYVQGEIHPQIKVAMREISLTESKPMFTNGTFTKDENPPVTVYDTSGPYTDPSIEIDVKKGIPKVRSQWILNRGDVEELDEDYLLRARAHSDRFDISPEMDEGPSFFERILKNLGESQRDLRGS